MCKIPAICSYAHRGLFFPANRWAFIALILLSQFPAFAEGPVKGKIGLTLSGGGAKGFAHIGVLHVIDSLGLKVNYISGTSMGSIVGGLYAAGYSAGELEKIALSIDWANVFDSNPVLKNIHVRNRYASGKYLVELPFEKMRFAVRTGAIEGQQLWGTLEELFFHLRETEDFSRFPTPFACVTTNIETGEPVVISSGDVISALRASTAIPAVFTAVEREGKYLVDGGAVNNFPVDVVKEMGAGYVIGVNVSQGLRKAEELKTPVDIIYQMGMFKNESSFERNRKKTNLYIAPDIDDYDISDFTDARHIIERGKQMARKFIPELKALATTNPAVPGTGSKLRNADYIVVDQLSYQGLKNIRERFLDNITDAYIKDTTTAGDISLLIQRLYATGYFERITYTYQPSDTDPGKKQLVFSFLEKQMNALRMGLHYNDFLGIGLMGGISTKKLLLHNLYGDFSFNLGRNPAYRVKVDFFTSEYLKNWMSLKVEGNELDFPYNDNFVTVAAYNKRFFRLDASINQTAGKNSYFFAGASYYFQRLQPTILTDIALEGKNSANEIFAGVNKYTLDRHAFPRSGQHLSLETSWILNQKPSLNIIGEDENVNQLSQTDIEIDDFFQLKFLYALYQPVRDHSSFFTRFQAGYNYNYSQGFLNMFNVGGTTSFLRDQILFPGIDEYGVLTPAVITAELGWNINTWSGFYLTPLAGAALYDFDIWNIDELDTGNVLLGTSLSLGYFSPLGPLTATVSYSPQKNRVLGYIHFGWNF
ncbi:MAG: patatin-like phospholipase family protein [Bacteroidales bacterium]|nr:patatin-like phospholipase family protein [Bacteroidales bacterium]MDT8433073.1 patatin-like phospholipase family protein [Bacteroidales bacterium]